MSPELAPSVERARPSQEAIELARIAGCLERIEAKLFPESTKSELEQLQDELVAKETASPVPNAFTPGGQFDVGVGRDSENW